jgi:hypothetical protein
MDKKVRPEKTTAVRRQFLYALAAVILFAILYNAATYYGWFSYSVKPRLLNVSDYKLYDSGKKKIKAVVFFGAADTDGLKPAPCVIFESNQPVNEIKQLLEKMFSTPAAAGYVNVIPDSTQLREAYQDKNGILYLDLSDEFSKNCKSGITSENLAVYSIVDSICYNFPWVKGVKILIDGAEKQDVAGNVSLEGVFRPDMNLSAVKL